MSLVCSFDHCPGESIRPTLLPKYGNFDIILNHFSRVSQLCLTPHALCAVFYLVPMLIGW